MASTSSSSPAYFAAMRTVVGFRVVLVLIFTKELKKLKFQELTKEDEVLRSHVADVRSWDERTREQVKTT